MTRQLRQYQSERHAQTREQMAQAIVMLERLGVIDFNGHVSVRVSNRDILINSGASVRSAISESDFISVDLQGAVLDSDAPAPPAELPMHLAVYAARPDVHAIVHGHPLYSTILSGAGHEYAVVMPQGALLDGSPVFPSAASIDESGIAEEMVRALGDAPALLLQAHGVVVTGANLLEAWARAVYLELNCERQVLAIPLGGMSKLPDPLVACFKEKLSRRNLLEKCWEYYRGRFAMV